MSRPEQQGGRAALLHVVYDLIRGGSEGQCALTALHLARRGWSQRVAVFRRRGFFLEEVERHCGPVHEIRIRHLVASETWKEVRRLAAFLRDTGVGIVHAWDMDAVIFGGLAARIAGIPFVSSHRDTGEIYPWYKQVLRALVDRLASRVIANCQAAAASVRWRRWLHRDVEVVPNLLDLDRFDTESLEIFSRAESVPRGWNAVVVSRLDPEKDIVCAVEAVGRFYVGDGGKAVAPGRGPKVNLVVAGAGPEREALRAAAARWAIGDKVVLLGDVPDVPALLKHARVGLLLPQSNEGLSNAILEYMAAGLPVIATQCGGNSELVEHGVTGWLVPPRSPAAVSHFMARLLEDPDLAARMGQAARGQAEKFRPDIILPRLETLYCSIAGERTRGSGVPSQDSRST